VFDKEPLPAESPFWGMENVLVTPHCISDVEDWKREAGELVIAQPGRSDGMRGWAARTRVMAARGSRA
jgi:phosphoglycerate dehydrogenase-like enzyme